MLFNRLACAFVGPGAVSDQKTATCLGVLPDFAAPSQAIRAARSATALLTPIAACMVPGSAALRTVALSRDGMTVSVK